MKIATYKIDFISNTLTITKAFEVAANCVYSEEYKTLCKIMADFPSMKIIRQTSAARYPNPYKGLTYEAMKQHIMVSDRACDLMDEFEMVKHEAVIMPNCYLYVKNWFLERFPEWVAKNRSTHAATEIMVSENVA